MDCLAEASEVPRHALTGRTTRKSGVYNGVSEPLQARKPGLQAIHSGFIQESVIRFYVLDIWHIYVTYEQLFMFT